MKKLPLVGMTDLNEGLINSKCYQDIFLVSEMNCTRDPEAWKKADSEVYDMMRMEELLLVLIVEGTVGLTIDYIPYELKRNSLVTIMPSHVCQLDHISPDLKAYVVVATHEFLEECAPSQANRGQSIANYMEVRKNPCTDLNEKERNILESHIFKMRERIGLNEHFFQKEMIQNAFMAFLFDMANMFMRKKVHLTKPSLTRKEEIMEKFLKLLMTHCKEEHLVTFYAEKLFITPQYLSLILKELSGKSANKWIDETLIMEAKTLLKAPDATVQGVAAHLNFSDQSTFGKFFKKHIGISPSEYRKS